jgi:hypothetical protein
MIAVRPRSVGLRKSQVGFVDQRRGLQRLPGTFTPHVRRREASKLVIDLWKKVAGGAPVMAGGHAGTNCSREVTF